MSDAKLVNIARLMTSYNFEIEDLPDNLKCAQCKFVLKIACHGPCCCRYCRACVDDMMARGSEFCPGDTEDCRESFLSRFNTDHVSNRGVSRLIVKCPNNGCVHECQLANMVEHLRECPTKSEECPFRELGCTQDKLAAKEMGGHLQHENRGHSEILIGMVANINREIEVLKERDEQIKLIMDQMIHVQNENKSIRNDIKSIKEEIEGLVSQVRVLAEGMEREISERRENGELDSASRVIDHVDREIAAVTGLIGSNKDELDIEMQSLRGDIGSIDQGVQSIKNDICSVTLQVQSIQVQMRHVEVGCVWLIYDDVSKTSWDWEGRHSEHFSGTVHPYKYRLTSGNYYIGTARAVLRIDLRIGAGPNDVWLTWPFEARVVITVTDWDKHEACRSISLQCQIERPADNCWKCSDVFKFRHSELIKAGLNLSRGVRVSCVIVPGADQ